MDQTLYRTLFIIILLALNATAGVARADIYRLEGDDDTISFSDSPKDKRFQLIMKEQRTRLPKKSGAEHLNHQKITEQEGQQSDPVSVHNNRDLPIQGRITSTMGMRNDPFNGRLTHHNGLDIATPSGTPVKPVAPGTVIFSGWKGGYGNMVILAHQDGMITIYAHHTSNSVNEGDRVTSDTIIAHSGSTGRSTGPHLHFEAWRKGINITPEFMPGHLASQHAGQQNVPLAATPIKRYLQTDGSIIFTNLR